MFDKIEKIGKSLIQHGPNNDRVYLLKLHPDDKDKIVDELYRLSILKRYSKIFAKVPEWAIDSFLSHEYKEEASIPQFYNGETKVCFMSQFFTAKRSFLNDQAKNDINQIIELSANYFNATEVKIPENYSIRQIRKDELKPLAKLYKSVFKVYPFPIFKEKYLLKTMESNVVYYGVFKDEKLAAASSAEMDLDSKNSEMTDFATHTKHLGQNLSYFLLKAMEEDMKSRGIRTVYTIARANSHGMNKTFGRAEYRFGGTLVNNTQIGKSIESMNVWYKQL